jgi:hypothetical protein
VLAAFVVCFALLLVPGLGAALAVAAPGAMSIEARLALAFGLGYGLVAGVATLLALAHVLSRPAFIACVLLATAGVWALAFLRASPRVHWSALRSQARDEPLALAAGLALLLAVAFLRPFYPAELNLSVAASWRYWADGLEVAASGGVPAESAQWGTEIPTTVSKVIFNAFEGGVSFLLGPDPLESMQGILAVTAVGLTAALLALGRELGLRLLAPLVPALALFLPAWLPFSRDFAVDLDAYKAENVGRMVAFCAVVAGIAYVRGRHRPALAAVAGALLAVAGLTHLVPALVAGLILALYGISTALFERSALRHVLVGAAATALVFAVSYVGVLGLAGGDLGFQRATSSTTFTGLPPNIDPTISFNSHRLVRSTPEGPFYIRPAELARSFALDAVPIEGSPGVAALVLAALGLATIGMVLVERALLPLAIVAWGVAVTLLAVGLFFSYRYRTHIPGNFGPRRLFGYMALLPALVVPGFLEVVLRPLTRRSRLVLTVLPLLAGVVGIGAAAAHIPERSLPEAEAGLSVIERVARVVPCGARMLPNARTAGSWEATIGRRSVIEGMAPYLRPEVMAHVLPLLVDARKFFLRPRANLDFLARQRVDYVVFVRPGPWIGTPGGFIETPGDLDALKSLPELRPVLQDSDVSVFAVGDADAQAGVQPRRCPRGAQAGWSRGVAPLTRWIRGGVRS